MHPNLRSTVLCALAILVTASTLCAQDDSYPPGTFQLNPAIDLNLQPVPVAVPEKFRDAVPGNLTLNLPPSFSVSVFAAGNNLRGTRFMAFSPDGVLHVANKGRGQIVAFPDRDEDGVADEGIVVVDGLEEGHSLVFYKGDLYVAEKHQVIRLKDLDGDGEFEEREIFIPDIPWEGSHNNRTIVFDEIEEKIYLSVGSPCDLCRQEEGLQVNYGSDQQVPYSPERGTILQFNADGTGRRIFATGVRNVVGMDFHPVTNELWGNNNHYDLEGPDLPPEWIDIIRDGDFMGLPFVHGYQMYIDFSVPEYQKILPITRQDSLLVQTQKRPVGLVPAHLAPMGIHFYTHDLFPPQYKNAAFVALRGGQVAGNLAVVPGFKVVALFSEPDGSNARISDFLTGFGTGLRREDVWGKPVGLITDSRGNLYVTSDHAIPAVYRIEHSPLIGSWEHTLPEKVFSGSPLEFEATVRLERLAPGEGDPLLTADLSAFGGPESVSLEAVGENIYRLRASLQVEGDNGLRQVRVLIEQGPYQTRLVQTITILPGVDTQIFAGAAERNWAVEHNSLIDLDSAAESLLYQDHPASAFAASLNGLGWWNLEFVPAEPVNPEGFQTLRFAFHPGNVVAADGLTLSLAINKSSSEFKSRTLELLEGDLDVPGVDLNVRQWQVVEIPLDAMELTGPIERIRFFGNLSGTFFLEDIRLLIDAPQQPPTAVVEEFTSTEPTRFDLGQNYPNPFNSETVIRFSLPASTEVELAVYNMAGQKVATLIEGARKAGLYSVRWDGRDDRGDELASGLYLYQLRTNSLEKTHKMLLLR